MASSSLSYRDNPECDSEGEIEDVEGDEDFLEGEPSTGSRTGEVTKSLTSLLSNAAKTKAEVDSLEFAFLQPICIQVLKEPDEKNLKAMEEALKAVGKVPQQLAEYVMFPFAVQLKLIRTYKQPQRLAIFKTLALVLEKINLSGSYEIFVNTFQKLFVVLALPENVTSANKQIAEDELELIMKCVENMITHNLTYHLDTLTEKDKVQIIGQAVFILLQLVGPDFPKKIRIKALKCLQEMVELCNGKENRSKVFFKFLPGIISNCRKICIPSAGQTLKRVAQLSLSLMGKTIQVSVQFVEPKELEQADDMLSKIVELLSNDYVLNDDMGYRKSFLQFCENLTTRKVQLPKCSKTISKILLRMKDDTLDEISTGCVNALESLGIAEELSYDSLVNLMEASTTHLKSGNDTACILSLREASSTISTKKLTFIEFQQFLPVVFQFMDDVVWKFRNKITVDNSKVKDPVFIASSKLCQHLVNCVDVEEVIYEFTSVISNLQNNLNRIKNPTGVIVTLNIVILELTSLSESFNEYEAANLAEVYLSLVDIQSTEVALTNISSDIPALQSAAEIRKAYLLEGLGILGKAYPKTVVPIVLYPLIEHAGLQNSEAVNEAADLALERISSPLNLEIFLKENLDFIMNEMGVRMLNLLLYPNCPSAMVYLAKYFDFSQDRFGPFIDQIFQRCSDTFGGGNVQHIYVQVFYALVKSISNHFKNLGEDKPVPVVKEESLLEKMVAYQKHVGILHPSLKEMEDIEEVNAEDISENAFKSEENEAMDVSDEEEPLDAVRELVLKISHRVLNFLPNNDRVVRLAAMESLICAMPLLKNHENSLLPLSHTIWQNLVPRFNEKDYVIVRKSFQLLETLCTCCGTFLAKRTIEEAFPRLSTLLLTLAKEGEQVKNKNRQFYTYTQAYKLQLSVLQGMGSLLDAIDVQEVELDKIVSGCIMYLRPDQHKNLREAASKLLETIANGKNCRAVWMKLVACGIRSPPSERNESFAPLPKA